MVVASAGKSVRAATTASTITISAGSSRRARRIQKAANAIRPRTAQFVEQQRGDQKSAEHEEDVDTEEPAGNTGDAAVLGKDESNRDGADAVQRGDAPWPSAMPARDDTDLAHCAKFRCAGAPNPEGALAKCRRPTGSGATSSTRCI